MPALLIYLLKANIALTLFYLAYRFGLRRLTFYVLNRFFLLTGIVCSSVFPLIDVNALLQRHQQISEVVAYVPDLGALQLQPVSEFTVWHLLVYIFWVGVAVMAIRFFMQLLSLWRLHRQSQAAVIQQLPVKALQQPVNPFSFFKNIYINPSQHAPMELDAILQHEQVHVEQWHTIDVMMAELNNIFYWFNPGAWLMRTAVRENLEFITDRRMLQQGIDRKIYQYNLIKVSGIPYATAIANNFNLSHLKNRIKMMNSKRSAKYNMLRYLVLGCVVAVALLSLNYSRAAFKHAQTGDVTDTIPAAPVAPVAPDAPKLAPVAPDARVPATPGAGPLAAIVPEPRGTLAPTGPDTFPPPPPPPAPVPGRVPPPPPPQAPPPPPPPRDPDTVRPKITMCPPDFKGLWIVDGVEVDKPDITPKDIIAINVWKPEEARPRYGDKGKNGVIEITTNKGKGRSGAGVINFKRDSTSTVRVVRFKRDSVKVRSVTLTMDTAQTINKSYNYNYNTNTNAKTTISIRGLDSLKAQPLVIVNGKVKTLTALNTMPKDKITSVNVLKGESAVSIYGSAGVNGVIMVNTKDTVTIK
ncbi:TonB-dependent outer membrane receptor, SusC/RagA subfamily, signature region [Chitinophaga rupis]|uniref:TonB-dependent outer membrane receptor, SusC/RagA subfamily, signature region n=1 Tax=Chitinophaga rupis TaxID=573321 RepID=A0A1H7WP23_9BACT|nr:M56 family metallopeptidase [Chitinophaga rupis]SEM22778.1 TonB-dependent outer membrane receptor, SusC/RagA subfamily, signature region [Chitinophaga rupis]